MGRRADWMEMATVLAGYNRQGVEDGCNFRLVNSSNSQRLNDVDNLMLKELYCIGIEDSSSGSIGEEGIDI